jgi:hypothetical protein
MLVAADLRAACILAEAKLCRGSRIDVWADGAFWAAKITAVRANGFKFTYCGAFDGGFVRRDRFLAEWRFPVENARQAALAEVLALTTDPAA